MSILREKVLLDQSTAGAGSWIALDSRYENGEVDRVLICELTSTDTVRIEGIIKDVKGIDKSFLDSLDADDIGVITTFSADGVYVLSGAYTYIRAVKVGTTANAKVSGMV